MKTGMTLALAALAFCTGAQNAPSPEAQAQMTFDPSGHVRSCTILKSSGDAKLDRTTCEKLRVCAEKRVGPQRPPTCTWQIDSKPQKHGVNYPPGAAH